MRGHEPTSRNARYLADRRMYRTGCTCGWTWEWPVDADRPDHAHHAVHVADMLAELRAFHRDYYQRTHHCGQCGQPGSFCLCTDKEPCGCSTLHPLGSGVGADPAEVFAEVPVSDDQQELFS